AVEIVGAAKDDDIKLRRFEELAVVAEVMADAVPPGEPLGVIAGRRDDGEQFSPHDALQRLGVDGRNETRPDQTDPNRLHGSCSPIEFSSNERVHRTCYSPSPLVGEGWGGDCL